jgi:hypothetical protein
MYTAQYLVNAGVELDVLGHVGEPVAHRVDVQGQVLTEMGAWQAFFSSLLTVAESSE